MGAFRAVLKAWAVDGHVWDVTHGKCGHRDVLVLPLTPVKAIRLGDHINR